MKLNEKQMENIGKIKNQFEGTKKQDKNSYEYLIKLNNNIKRPAEIVSLSTGIGGSLVFGTGISMCLGAIAGGTVLGVIVGVAGAGIATLAYPIYKLLRKKGLKTNKKEMLSLIERLESNEM